MKYDEKNHACLESMVFLVKRDVLSERLAMTGDARPVGNQQLSTRQGIAMQKQMKHSKFLFR